MRPSIRLLVTGAFLIIAAPCFAQPFGGGGRWREHREEFREEMKKKMEELGLSDEQREKLKVLQEQRDAMHDEKKALWDERRALWESMQDRSISDETLAAKFKELSARQQALEEKRFQGFLARRSILTPEQFSQMTDFWKEKRESFMKKRAEGEEQKGE